MKDHGGGFLDDIFVIDLNAMTIKENSIKCTEATQTYGSIITNNNSKQILMTHGFIRKCYKSYKTLTDLPYYLIDLVHSFYSINIIHLIQKPQDNMIMEIIL